MNPPVVPDHTLLRPIGRGAYGEVWLARNAMGTLRAVKIVWRKQFESDRPYDREFAGIRRYEPLSRSADGLVHVLHVGRNDSEAYYYYVMELADNCQGEEDDLDKQEIAGYSLPLEKDAAPDKFDAQTYSPRTLKSEVKRHGRLAIANCLRIALDSASGLAQLHRRGLVHRDVKPGNIIFVDDRAKLADIGLVSARSEGGTFVGTEGYIPPEGPGSPGADIYALGVALYEASTGYPPDRFPEAPSEWFADEAPPEPLEFHQIILKACEAQRERRYQNVEALQADLALLQSGQSVRRIRTMERRLGRARRIGGISALAIAIALTVAGLARYRESLMSENLAQESRLRDQAERSRNRAETAETATRQQLYAALLEQARATVHSGELGQRVRSLAAVERAAAISNTPELRGVALTALMLPDLRFELEVPTGPGITLAELDPVFQRIALCRGTNSVEIRSVPDRQLIAELPASTNLPSYAAWWSADSRYLAVSRDSIASGERAELEIWNIVQGRQVLVLHQVAWSAFSFHPRTKQVISGNPDGTASLWDLEMRREANRFTLPGPPIRLKYAPDGKRFAAVCGSPKGETVSICDASTGALLASHNFSHHIGIIDWHPASTWISVPEASGTIYLMDSRSGEVRTLGNHYAEAVTSVFSPDGNYLVSGGWDRELICWDVKTMRPAFVAGLKSFIVRFRADARECAVITDAGVELHAIETPVSREFSEGLGSRVLNAAFSPDGRWVAAAGDERLGVWRVNGMGTGTLDDHGARATLTFGNNTELFACGNDKICRWKVSEGADASAQLEFKELEFPGVESPSSLCISSNDLILTGAKGSCALPLNDIGNPNISWKRTADGNNGISPDGRWLGIYSPFSEFLEIYSLPGMRHVVRLKNESRIASFAFSPRDGELAIASHDQLEFYSTTTWQRTRAATNFAGIIFRPDEATCWLSKDFRSAGLHDARTFESLLPLPPHAVPLAVSRDGRWLAMSVDSRRVRLIDLIAVRAKLRLLGVDWEDKPGIHN